VIRIIIHSVRRRRDGWPLIGYTSCPCPSRQTREADRCDIRIGRTLADGGGRVFRLGPLCPFSRAMHLTVVPSRAGGGKTASSSSNHVIDVLGRGIDVDLHPLIVREAFPLGP